VEYPLVFKMPLPIEIPEMHVPSQSQEASEIEQLNVIGASEDQRDETRSDGP
jgi:hypothetical protein